MCPRCIAGVPFDSVRHFLITAAAHHVWPFLTYLEGYLCGGITTKKTKNRIVLGIILMFSTARGQTSTWQCCSGVGGFSSTICRQYVRRDMPLSLTLCSCLFIAMLYWLCCPCEQNVRDFFYREKDVGRGFCHGHISHLVHPKILILDRREHAKKWPENLANTFSDTLAIHNFFYRLTPAIFSRRWQVPLDKLVNLTSDLSSCPLAPFQITWQVITCQVGLVKLIWQILISAQV